MKKALLILTVVCTTFLSAQNKWRFFIPGTFSAGASLVETSGDSGSVWQSNTARHFQLCSGGGLLYNKRLGVYAEGGAFLSSYSVQKTGAEYNITHLKWIGGLHPFVLFPFKNTPQSNFHIGFGAGNVFAKNETLYRTRPGYNAVTTSAKLNSFTYAPEIGITRIEDRFNFSILLTYYYQDTDLKAFQSTVTDAVGSFTIKNKADFIGIKFSFAYRIGKDKTYPEIYKKQPGEHEQYISRTTTTIKKIETSKDHVILSFYESSKEDNDSIAVSVNGKYILTSHKLMKEKTTIRVPLEKGENTITVYAINEGEIPPNTGTCLIEYGFKKEEFPVQTGLKKNASIIITRK